MKIHREVTKEKKGFGSSQGAGMVARTQPVMEGVCRAVSYI